MAAQVTLHLGAESSHVNHHALALGYASLARQWMRHTPPTPLDIEHAIEQTEDVVMPLAAKLARTEQLLLRGEGAALILQGVGAKPDETLRWSLEELEDIFNRIAMVSEGRPSSHENLPTTPEFYAAMAILRECIHHLRVSEVVLQAQWPQFRSLPNCFGLASRIRRHYSAGEVSKYFYSTLVQVVLVAVVCPFRRKFADSKTHHFYLRQALFA